jgi:phosphatidylglycerophosphate synthase
MVTATAKPVGGLDGRKHERRYQNILDCAALGTVAAVSRSIAKHPWITPNMVTMAGNVMRFTAVGLFAMRIAPVAAVLLTAAGIYLDNVDGHLARLTHRVSDFGDKLDHYSDWLWGASLTIVYFWRYFSWERHKMWLTAFVTIMLLVYTVQFGSLEKIYHHRCPEESTSSDTTAFTKRLAGVDPVKVTLATRPVAGNVMLALITLAFMWRCYRPL